jgi:hypothetical protein
LIEKVVPPNVSARDAVVVQGTVNPPWPSEADPGIAAWIATALRESIL